MAETHPVIQRLSLRMYCNAACFGSFSIAAPQEIAASSPSVACQWPFVGGIPSHPRQWTSLEKRLVHVVCRAGMVCARR